MTAVLLCFRFSLSLSFSFRDEECGGAYDYGRRSATGEASSTPLDLTSFLAWQKLTSTGISYHFLCTRRRDVTEKDLGGSLSICPSIDGHSIQQLIPGSPFLSAKTAFLGYLERIRPRNSRRS